jgi:MoxR-like ATPase
MAHRLVLSLDALADDVPATGIVDRILEVVPEPQIAPRQDRDEGPHPPLGLRESA